MEPDTPEYFITESRKAIEPLAAVTSVDVAVKTLKGKVFLVNLFHILFVVNYCFRFPSRFSNYVIINKNNEGRVHT